MDSKLEKKSAYSMLLKYISISAEDSEIRRSISQISNITVDLLSYVKVRQLISSMYILNLSNPFFRIFAYLHS